MNDSIRYGITATIIGLLVISSLSGSGPTTAAASNNQGTGVVSSAAAASSSLSSSQTADLPSTGQTGAAVSTPAKPLTTKAVAITIDALTNRHPISTYVYGGAYPQDAATITDSGLTEVRWGGDATSTYNWQLQTYNAANDYYFEDYAARASTTAAMATPRSSSRT